MTNDDGAICIVDDDVSARESMADWLSCSGLRVETFASADEYLSARRTSAPSCLVLDLELPGRNGLDLQAELARAGSDVPIVFVSGHGDVPLSVRAIKAGAADFLTKPFEPDSLLNAIRGATTREAARPEPSAPPEARPRHARSSQHPSRAERAEIVGASPALADVMHQARTVAATDATVLVYGETGTGKELIARAVHELSERRHGPFVKVNCGAIPAGLLESELMGHERGAFTGALAQRIGRFELAQDGTLFLDEIGELALELQPKLLRVLQEREFERVGGTRTLRSNARLIAATNRDLGAMVRDRRFREDLYYRVNVFPLLLPPLRVRRDDIPALATHFMREMSERFGKALDRLSPAAVDRLKTYDWPGNVRELRNVIERAAILATGPVLEVPSLRGIGRTDDTDDDTDDDDGGVEDLAEINRAHIIRVLEATRGIVSGPDGAAARLGLKRSTLNYRMRKLGIRREPPTRGVIG